MRTVQMRSKNLILSTALAWLLTAIVFGTVPFVQAQTFTVLYSFTGGADGGDPLAGLVVDSEGNLYGTTSGGGAGLLGCVFGCGVVFKVDPSGNETVLHNFGEVLTDGAGPAYGSLLRDGAGDLYGTTSVGGTEGSGTIFRLSATGKETVVSFKGGADGGFPDAGIILGTGGTAYGTTYYRGTGCPPYGCGTVYKVNASGKITLLHSFTNGADGAYPLAGLVQDSAGNLYGTTLNGGTFGIRGRVQD